MAMLTVLTDLIIWKAVLLEDALMETTSLLFAWNLERPRILSNTSGMLWTATFHIWHPQTFQITVYCSEIFENGVDGWSGKGKNDYAN